jgi:hypothetical protein
LNLASLHMRLRDFDSARKVLEPLRDSDVRIPAQAMLDSIENYKKVMASPGSVVVVEDVNGSKETITGTARPTLKRREEVMEEKPRTNSPTGAPISLEGTEKLAGVITAAECKGDAMVISLTSESKVVRFQVKDHNQVPFFRRAITYSVDITCGPNNLQAIIYFKPLAGSAALAGDVVAVEFK